MGKTQPSRQVNLSAGFADLSERIDRVPLPSSSYSVLLARLDRKIAARNRRAVAFVGAFALVAAFIVVFNRTRRPNELSPFEVASASAEFSWRTAADGTVAVTRGNAELALDSAHTHVAVHAGSRLRAGLHDVRVLAGTLDFDVEPHGPGVALRVLVSHGAIEVTGTQFTVTQNDQGGSVELKRGHIRFVANMGDPIVLAAGQTLTWPLPVASATVAPKTLVPPEVNDRSEPSASGTSTAARRAAESRAEAEASPEAVRKYLTELDALRIRHDYPGLATRLVQVLRGPLQEPLRESLSFELCDVLVHKIHDHARACDTITRHLRRYPKGSYTQRLQAASSAMGCSP